MDPQSPATLHRNDTVYLRIGYSSDVPVYIWLRPYYQGKPANAGTSGSRKLPAGEGELFAWFFMSDAGQVDELRLFASLNGWTDNALAKLSVPADFTWSDESAPARQPAAWVAPLLAQERQQQKQAYDAYMNRPPGPHDFAIMSGFTILVIASLLACFVWPLWGVIRWRGKWRVLAAIPCAAICLWVLKDCSDLHADPTSHNLLPFEFLEAAVFIAPYMLVVWLLRRVALKREAADA